ncbi:hypothetical protein GSI_13791 [Ganoderma sinense ZZ0214-1]|uniref:Uncharacterized protein n=1 Tax=Ganoderma sinense ZZ0214-1 TaxID=1077348 RepID=A0A2G8RRA1_9APHY|nr:hypothetical protein GSI_13791 [Ganoderma sinense ZZ0214-1]
MVDLSAPQPRLAPALFPNRSLPRNQSRPLAIVDDTFYSLPKPRTIASPKPILTPYVLPEDSGLHKLSSKPPCSPTKRRRALNRNLPRSTRHRHCARSDCCINTFSRPLTSFDDLPWISALSIEPDSANPWDIADLSLLDTSEKESSGPGPVRRRKTSLRSNPLAQPRSKEEEDSWSVPLPFIRMYDFADPAPRTPPPKRRFSPSDVVFHDLHPVLPSEATEQPSRPTHVGASP